MQSQDKSNRVPEKVPEKVWEALVQPGQVQPGSGEGWEALVQSQVRFNRVPEKVPGSLGAKPSQVQQDLRPFNSRKPS